MRTMKMHSAAMLGAVALTLGVASQAAADPVAVDAKVAPYKVVSGVSGSLSSVGSDTLNNLMTFWSEKFNKFYPNVKMQVEGKGSSTAPPDRLHQDSIAAITNPSTIYVTQAMTSEMTTAP